MITMGWNDVTSKSKDKDNTNKKTKYNKLTTGKTHTIRILDAEPFSRYSHWIQAANNGRGVSVDCPGAGCPICADIKEKKKTGGKQVYSSRKLHAINILNRETGEVEIIDKGKGLFEALEGLLVEVGDLRKYDVKIRVIGEGNEISYTPIALPPKPLTEAEKALTKYDLKNITLKPTPEQLQMLMNGAALTDVFGNNNAENTDNESQDKPSVDFTS